MLYKQALPIGIVVMCDVYFLPFVLLYFPNFNKDDHFGNQKRKAVI